MLAAVIMINHYNTLCTFTYIKCLHPCKTSISLLFSCLVFHCITLLYYIIIIYIIAAVKINLWKIDILLYDS